MSTYLNISINSINEQYHSSKAVVLLFLINAVIQCAFHLLKFLRYRATTAPKWLQKLENALDISFSLGIVCILNIISFSTYVFACIISFFFIFLIFFFQVGSKAFPVERRGLIMYGGPAIFLLMLFLNYFIDNQRKI